MTSFMRATGTAALLALSPLAGASADEPVRGGELIASLDLQPKSLDPAFGDADTIDRYLFNQIYEPLIRLDADGEIVPILATGYAYGEDEASITFDLREGVTFHDGTPFNADAVVFNLERVMDPEVGASRQQDVADIASVEKLGEHRVRVNLTGPSGAALAGFAAEGTLMVSPTAVETHGEDYSRNPVGTGPFRFVDWPGGERVILERNAEYWRRDAEGRDLPYLDGVVIRSIRNYATALLELESGNVHVLDVVNPQDFDRLDEAPDIDLVPTPQVTHLMIALNVSKPPFDDKTVRQAIAQSMDREILAQAIAGRYGTVTPTFLPPSDWAYDASIEGWGHDPEAAKALLAEAGHPDGLSFELAVIQREPDTTVAQILQQMMREAGFDVELAVLERQSWIDRVLRERTYEAGMLRGNFPRIDPHASWGRFFWDEGSNNWVNHENHAVFDMIDDARATTDVAKRKARYKELAETLLDESYMIFLFNRPAIQAARENVRSIGQDVGGAWLFAETWLEE